MSTERCKHPQIPFLVTAKTISSYSGDRRTPLSNLGVCQGGMVWQVETMVDERDSTPFVRFFVGTEDQYRHLADPTGKDAPACE
jgi:hypothetical protein